MTETEAVTSALAAMLFTCTTSRPWAQQDEGPYHRDAQPQRRDIVEDREGVPLQLGIRLAGDDSMPVPDATVEIWQCDALGRYSGFPPPDDSAVVTAQNAPRGQYLADQAPYAERPGRDTTNGTDEIFPTGGDPAVVDVIPDGGGYRAATCLLLPRIDVDPPPWRPQ